MISNATLDLDSGAVLKAIAIATRQHRESELSSQQLLAQGLREHWPLAQSLVDSVWQQLSRQGVAVVKVAGFAALSRPQYQAVAVGLSALFGQATTNAGTRKVVWDVRPSDNRDLSTSLGSADFHTDSSFRAVPERMFGLWCLCQADVGGDSTLIDVHDLVPALESRDPAALAVLSTAPIPFYNGHDLHEGPVFARTGPAVRYRTDFIEAGLAHMRPEDEPEMRAALDVLTAQLTDPGLIRSIRVERDEAIFIDNHRMLHGRAVFQDPARHLLRIRIDVDQA